MFLSSGFPDRLLSAFISFIYYQYKYIFKIVIWRCAFLFIVKTVLLITLLNIDSWMDRSTEYNTVQSGLGSSTDYLQIIWITWSPLWNVGVLQIEN